jgi:hypothetical protein
MDKEKVFILGSSVINKFDIAKDIIAINDNLNIANNFTTDIIFKDKITDTFEYYLSTEDVKLAFKNNALMFGTTVNDITSGVTISDMYNSDIIAMSYDDFNNISNKVFTEITPIICWIDSNNKEYDRYKHDLIEASYCIKKIDDKKFTTLYFNLDSEQPDKIANIINTYISGDEIVREEILEENS